MDDPVADPIAALVELLLVAQGASPEPEPELMQEAAPVPPADKKQQVREQLRQLREKNRALEAAPALAPEPEPEPAGGTSPWRTNDFMSQARMRLASLVLIFILVFVTHVHTTDHHTATIQSTSAVKQSPFV